MITNFWKSCKNILDEAVNLIPSFGVIECTNYFKKTLLQSTSGGRFEMPKWVPSLASPHIPFNDEPPTYRAVTNAINKCRSAASPCPLDQMPVLVMKKCPIVRTALHKLIVECWRQRNIPQCWKEAMSVLIYKKGDTADVANFRPITLQPIFYKVLSAVYRNRLYGFLSDNNYIDTHTFKRASGLSATAYRNILSY
jgi:hypothetical protein